jgi:replication factor C subunit 2/4
MENSIPWIEKYRPSKLEDLVLDDRLKHQLQVFVQKAQFHLIITGPSGVGKSSCARSLAASILKNNFSNAYLELNAAEDRSTKMIVNIIPPFCKRNLPGSKIIVFDEADNLTSKCQMDISRMIRTFGRRCSFIFTCNESSRIIEDIQSLCQIIRFPMLTRDQIIARLRHICKHEKIICHEMGANLISYLADGDLRKAINILQVTAFAYGKINKTCVLQICRIPDPMEMRNIFPLIVQGDMKKVVQKVDHLRAQGYHYQDIIISLNYLLMTLSAEELAESLQLGSSQSIESLRLRFMDIINRTRINMNLGFRTKLQLLAMIARMVQIVQTQIVTNTNNT